MHLSWLDPHKMRKMTVVGREKMVVFDDMELERKVTIYEKSPGKRAETYGEWQTRTGDIFSPKISTDEPLRLECTYFLELVDGRHDRGKVARDGSRVVRALELLPNSLEWLRSTRLRSSIPGTVLGEGVKVLEDAVVGKQPSLVAALDREARAAAAGDDRRRHDRLDGRDRLRRLDDRRQLHPRRPVVRPRARADRRRLHSRPRLADRERHDDRREHEDPGRARTSPPTRRSRRTSSSRRAS